MNQYTVVVTDHDFADLSIERGVLGDVADVVALTDDIGAQPENATVSLTDADGVLNLRYALDPSQIEQMTECRIIARYGIGVDNVDVETAVDHGIYVTNVPGYCLEEVVTHAISLLLALGRGLKTYDASVAEGEWDRDVAAPIHRLSTQTVGVIGYGVIGRAVGRHAAALGANVVASDPFLEPGDIADEPADLVGFDKLLDQSDYVSVHSPLTDDTRGMFDADAFRRMRPSAYLVNVARGPIIDGNVLRTALADGEIAGAGLDVFPNEPPAPDNALRTHDRVISTPHIGWYSEEANAERRRSAAENVRKALLDETPDNVVHSVE